MQTRIIKYLTCPSCKVGAFSLFINEAGADGRVKEGSLKCKSCSEIFMISNFIPIFIKEIINKKTEKTAKSFGHEWNYYSEKLGPLKDKFLIDIPPIQEDFFKGKVVLDVGCGMGRLTKLSAQYGAAEVFACDISESVEAAYRYVGNLPNVHVIRADLNKLPFSENFDFIYSLGVIHHTSDRFRSFSSISSHLKPGGTIAIWVYAKEGNMVLRYLIAPIQFITRKLSFPIKHSLAVLGELILSLFYKVIYVPINTVPWFRFLKKFLFYNDYFSKYFFGPYHSAEDRRSVLFDFMSTEIIYYISGDEIKRWFSDNGLKISHLTFLRNQSWGAVGERK
ncbi:MAG: class I SAM-dependent methyltransferase [Candidatus Omnitrophica bacterium]|nr:class I SAM-dependent methyltransferase [Candidatus Omnitrophota bacterium]